MPIVASLSISELVLSPVAVLAVVLGIWRLGADPGWTSHFLIFGGQLSGYQSWFAIALGAETTALFLKGWASKRILALASIPRARRQGYERV